VLLALSGGILTGFDLISNQANLTLEKKPELLTQDQIIDFHSYSNAGRPKDHCLAVLLLSALKIYRYVRKEAYYKHETKVKLMFM
jgi:hypothetical protein